MNDFCKRLKELRLERNLTQTDVANALGVTTQAVSKWESQSSLPDIAMLIPISEFYGVSVDYLLCHDLAEKEKEILDYLQKCEAFVLSPKEQWEDTLKETRSMLRKHPKDHRIMLELCLELFMYYKKIDSEHKFLIELLEWGDIIISQSTDSQLRYQVLDLEISAYCELGMYEKARELVETLPDFSCSKDVLLCDSFPKNTKEHLCAEQTLAYKCVDQLCLSMLNYGTDEESTLYTTKEKLSICQTVAALIRTYHSTGDYDGFTNEYLFRAELYSALYAAMDGDMQQAVVFLGNVQAVFEKQSTISATALQRSYKSPFLRELSAPLGCIRNHYQKMFKTVISNKAFNALREEEAFKKIEIKILAE